MNVKTSLRQAGFSQHPESSCNRSVLGLASVTRRPTALPRRRPPGFDTVCHRTTLPDRPKPNGVLAGRVRAPPSTPRRPARAVARLLKRLLDGAPRAGRPVGLQGVAVLVDPHAVLGVAQERLGHGSCSLAKPSPSGCWPSSRFRSSRARWSARAAASRLTAGCGSPPCERIRVVHRTDSERSRAKTRNPRLA